MQNLLEELNNKQKEAVENTEGPVLVIAGAGSGKTKVLTHKIAFLIQEKQVKPWNILAITFTNKAANEMKQRVENLLSDSSNDIWMGTFHSICVRILRRYIDRIGFDSSFIIFDTSDQRTLVKDCLKELKVDDKLFTDRAVLSEISNAKNEMLEPKAYSVKYANDFRKETIGKVYELYQKRLRENNAIDFDDIINYTIKILTENQDVLEYYTEKFKYVLVDEYQDTNKAQFMLISILASKYGNITVVGDNDQGIYSFRGADISNILNFERDFPGTKIIKLEQNYRCTGNILKAVKSFLHLTFYFFSYFLKDRFHGIHTDQQCGCIVKKCRHCRLDHACHTECDQGSVDTHDTSVVLVDLGHQTVADLFECDHNRQIICADRDIGDLSCKFCTITDRDSDICSGKCR